MTVKAAGCLVYREIQRQKFEYLLLKCAKNQHWTPPKGHLENGEDEKTAAVRETHEEAGLSFNDFEIVDGFEKTLHYKAWGKDKTVKYWLARLKNNNATIKLSSEHTSHDWFDVSSFRKELYNQHIVHENTKTLLYAAEDFLMKRAQG